jgi:hypothetical protein
MITAGGSGKGARIFIPNDGSQGKRTFSAFGNTVAVQLDLSQLL